MSGIHCCCRRLLLLNSSRLTGRNGVLLQITRKRHQLLFQISSLQNKVAFQKPKLVYNTNKLLLYRLASTNTTESNEPVSASNLKVSEVEHDSSQLNKESIQSDNQPEVSASTNGDIIDESSLPPIPSEITEAPVFNFVSTGLKEPSFQSLGLGSWWPSGLVQQVLEYLHINLDLPWWESILIFTVIIRCLLLPVNIKVRKESSIMINEHMPVINEFNRKMQEARMRGDHYTVAVHGQELQKYVRENKVSLFGGLKLMLVQTPVFLSMYYALRGMTNAPVETLTTGGLFWFKDLTEPDPFYLLPLYLSGTLLAVFETGAEGNVNALNSQKAKWLFRGLCAAVCFVALNFASCLTWYWAVSNTISLLVVAIFKIPVVKRLLKLPDINRKNLMIQSGKDRKGFIKEIKEGIESAKITRELEERERLSQIAFQKAGQGPVLRTFKKSPVLQKEEKS